MKNKYLISISFFILTACSSSQLDLNHAGTGTEFAKTLPRSVISSAPDNENDRSTYLAQHYWDDVDFNQINKNFSREDIKQKFVDYLSLLSLIPIDQVEDIMTSFLDKASVNATNFRRFIYLFQSFLNDSGSPLKNEEQYIMVLQYLVRNPKVDELNKIKARSQLKILYRNRQGNCAVDFSFINLLGQPGNLHSLQAPYIVILFYDPVSKYCRAATSELRNNPHLERLQQEILLIVVAVYTGVNSKLWLDYAASMPGQWLNVTDQQQIALHHKYDLHTLPSLYLLDGDKKVLLKNTSVKNLHNFLCDHVK